MLVAELSLKHAVIHDMDAIAQNGGTALAHPGENMRRHFYCSAAA